MPSQALGRLVKVNSSLEVVWKLHKTSNSDVIKQDVRVKTKFAWQPKPLKYHVVESIKIHPLVLVPIPTSRNACLRNKMTVLLSDF